jgi:hypothetical protein
MDHPTYDEASIAKAPTCLALLIALALIAAGTASPAAAAPAGNPDVIDVFFSRNPDSLNDFTAVFPVSRDVPSGAVAEDAVAALIAGPTAAEQAGGLFSDFKALIVGAASTCKGEDFLLMVTLGVATVQLCRQTASAGIGQDARAQAEINATLMQFAGITKVIVLGSTGHCLFEESGMDVCLN